jgi:dienelactone hydrolase
MKETCVAFGEGGRLGGIVTQPETPGGLGLVLVSAGILPKSGPFRLYAELARRLARDGVTTLRFDLGGLGDSLLDASGAPLKERTALEVRAAIDCLCSRDRVSDLVLGGLCSGAEDSLRSAATDTRVTGVVMIDPFAYRTSDWAVQHALHRAGRRLLRALGVYQPAQPPQLGEAPVKRHRAVSYHYMERSESMPILAELVRRQANVHFIYTAGVRESFNHPRQFRAQFPGLELGEKVTLDHLPSLDHTQLLAADRELLIETVARRLAAHPRKHHSGAASAKSG